MSRSDVGYAKYGQTLDKERRSKVKDLAEYLNDVQEELMDAILYIQAAREEIADNKYCTCVKVNSANGLPYYVTDVVLRKENTKTNKSRKFFITNKKLKECLENYKNEKRQKYQIAESSFQEVKSESFFQNQKGGGFNKITLQHLIKKMFRDVGLDEMCSSHSLRRTFITNLFQSGINTKIVSQLSGKFKC